MMKSLKMDAEAKFSATQKAAKLAIKEKDKASQERMDKVARLRALRLASEAGSQTAVAKPASEKNSGEK